MSVLFTRRGDSPSLYDPVFATNSWEDIIKACQRGEIPKTWLVGDSKAMLINGVEYQIDIIGKEHDTYSDGTGKAPLTFQLHDCHETTYAMNSTQSNINGWSSCEMRTTFLPAILTSMPSEVQVAIREVNKLTTTGNQSTTISTTADKLFLLSEIEVFGTHAVTHEGEGSQYAYYASGHSITKKVSGATHRWWERSPYAYNKLSFANVEANGATSANYSNNTFGVSFAFCF